MQHDRTPKVEVINYTEACKPQKKSNRLYLVQSETQVKRCKRGLNVVSHASLYDFMSFGVSV